MPVSVSDSSSDGEAGLQRNPTRLPFRPISRSHIMNCSYYSWYSRYRALTPKARLIPLSQSFVDYLRADGIYLPPDDGAPAPDDWSESENGEANSNDSDSNDDEDSDPSLAWQDVHEAIKSTIEELGGKVVPKLNWSAPKDATWIHATNDLECRTPNDIYTLLKASDFITHDLEHAFDGCSDGPDDQASNATALTQATIPYHLVLRKHIEINPSIEFRCFVRRRILLGACQRDLNHFEFLFPMRATLMQTIQDFFAAKLAATFPDDSFVFDVYIPAPHQRVWLIDINPWAPRTDPLLFSWLELLTMPELRAGAAAEDFVRLSLSGADESASDGDSSDQDAEVEEVGGAEASLAELRLVKRDDPEAYSFNTPQYSAHKLPKDVVDAGQGGLGGLREFAAQWKEIFDPAGQRPG